MGKPIRVLHVVGGLGTGGIQSVLIELYRHIDRSKVQFDFVVHIKSKKSYASEVESLGGIVYYIDNDAFEHRKWGKYILFWKKFYKEHPEYRIVHGHLRSTAAIYLWEAKKSGCITIAHSHNTTNGYGRSARIKDVLQFPVRHIADYCLGCSEEANEWMFGKSRSNSKTCTVLRNGIEVGKYTFREEYRVSLRRELGYQDTDIVIGNVGRLVAQKNQKILIEALRFLHEPYKLMLVGDGSLRQNLQEQISDCKLESRVIMLGSRDDVYKLLSAMDIFALPSQNEGLAIAAIEAQASGLPTLVSTAVPKDGYVTPLAVCVQGKTAADWAEAIQQISASERISFSDQITNAGYNICDSAERLQNLYLSILK